MGDLAKDRRGGTRRSPTRFAVVWCPDFNLQAVVSRVQARAEPVALVDDSRRQSFVLSRNEAASREGVEPGIRTVQALARCPSLRLERPSPAAETATARVLLDTALNWVPGIEETRAGMLTLDLSTQPEAEWMEQARCLRGRLYDTGLEAVVGLGETPSLARIAAFVAGRGLASFASGMRESIVHLSPENRLEKLDQLPLSVMEAGSELIERLRLWGVASPGAFARLEREAVAARLGSEGVEWWLRLTGRWRRPLRLVKLEEWFESHQDFEHELCEREPLLFVVNRLLDDLVGRVGRTGRAAAAVHVLLEYAGGHSQAGRLALPEPTLDHEILFHLVGGYLERLEMKAAVVLIRLRFEPSEVVASQRTLFGAGLRSRHRYEETLQRLLRLVGSERVGSPRLLDTHRPGTFELVPLPHEIQEAESEAGPPVTGLVLRRFVAGHRVEVRLREGRPFHLDSRRARGAVAAVSGPWKGDGDWWHRGNRWGRTEWDVELPGQGWFRLVSEEGTWSLEGRYD